MRLRWRRGTGLPPWCRSTAWTGSWAWLLVTRQRQAALLERVKPAWTGPPTWCGLSSERKRRMSEGVAGHLPGSQPPRARPGGGEVRQQLRRPPADPPEAVARYCGRRIGWAAAARVFSGNTATAVDKVADANHNFCRNCDTPGRTRAASAWWRRWR